MERQHADVVDVELTGVFTLMQQKVARIACTACDRCAMVNFESIATDAQADEMARARMCQPAIDAAAKRFHS